ncbi:hypothetical protein T12_8434 [Trichinella patagoniensis]|uniref:Uncharacterized protein n=1 Tax=Trichinella patagoniensis TaxID=990121 RepID=A0A0V0ZQX9_9BILA|nr:hypothetical protein T12_8434 [Trichinella patagoniensis]
MFLTLSVHFMAQWMVEFRCPVGHFSTVQQRKQQCSNWTILVLDSSCARIRGSTKKHLASPVKLNATNNKKTSKAETFGLKTIPPKV